MSDSGITNDCLHHYNSQHIQVRRDYFDLCVYDKCKFNQKLSRTGKKVKDEPNQECMAKIMRIMETLTDEERRAWYKKMMHAKDQGLKVSEIEPSEFPIPLAYHRICKLLYNTYGESVVRNSIAELIRRGYLKCSQATKNSIPVYVFNVKVVQNALRKQAQDKVNRQVLKSTATSEDEHENQDDEAGVEIDSQASEINTSECEIDSQASEINTINNYPNNLNLDSERDSFSSSHGSDDTQPSLSEVLEQLRAIQQENARLREEMKSLSQQRQPEASLERTEASMELSTGGQGVEKSVADVQGENTDHIAHVTTNTTQPEQQSLLPVEVPSQPAQEQPNEKGKGKGRKGKKASSEKASVPLTEEDQACVVEEKAKKAAHDERHRGIYARITTRRGFELSDETDIIIERKHINKLMEKYDDSQIAAIHKYLFERDPYWSDTKRKYSIGAMIIWKKAPSVAQILRDERIEMEQSKSTPKTVSGMRNFTTNPEPLPPAALRKMQSQPQEQVQTPAQPSNASPTSEEQRPRRQFFIKRPSHAGQQAAIAGA